ncbi:MAG: 50S ribosomal protein L31 [Christensenellales bacterium]
MKEGIHPDLHEVQFVCACGNTFKGTSTKAGDVIKLDICNKCHPFFTGKKVMVDATGRAEQFKKRHGIK